MDNREITIPQGRLLGGSSALNAMNFVVSSKEDLDAWAGLGNPGWDWENFSRYLNKTYTVTTGSETHNNGAIQTNIPEEENKWPQVWRDTLANLGFPSHNDPFSGTIHGAVMYPDAIHPESKTRSYAANAYLAPAQGRPNLTIWTGVVVEKILFDKPTDSDIVASGVRYTTRDGQSATVTARKEVILSAGVFHSPKILELSGIGDAALLSSLGIDVVVDNPHVGENLQHHPLSILSFETVNDGDAAFATLDALARQDPSAVTAATSAYTTAKRGPLSQTNCNAMAHLPFPGITTAAGQSDLAQLRATPYPTPPTKSTAAYTRAATALTHATLTSQTSASGYYVTTPCGVHPSPPDTPATSSSTETPANYFSIAVLLTRPLSRGSAHLTAPSIQGPQSQQQQPQQEIDPGYLTHPLDLAILSRHVHFTLHTLTQTPPLSTRLQPHGNHLPPSLSLLQNNTSLDLESTLTFLRETALPSTLYAGTCSMMPREMGGVVDPTLRVYGTRNVRVVDASVMPFITAGDTMATVYGIAEKAAEGIRAGL